MAQQQTVDIAKLMDDGRFSARQLVIVTFCGIFLLLDGYDGMQIAYVAPSLLRQWHLAPSMLTLIFVASGVSAVLGSFIFGPLADRHGRRAMLIGGVFAMGIASLGGAWSGSVVAFVAYRLLAGLGLGAVMPTAIALGAEYSPVRRRSFTVTAFYTGYALGASIGAGLAARIIPVYGWQAVMIIGGVAPLVIAVIALPIVPESIRFLVLHRPNGPQIPRELQRINEQWQFANCVFISSDIPTKTPVRDLFRDGRLVATLLIWVIYFMNIMEIVFLSSWIPTLAHRSGVPLGMSLDTMMILQVGAIIGGLVTGACIDRWRPAALVPVHVIGVVAVGVFGMAIGAGPVMFVPAFLIGVGVMGAQTGMNGFTAKLYPTAMRSSGVSAALGIGQVGTIIGPALGGVMFALGFSVATIFLLAALPPLISSISIITLWLRGRSASLAVAAARPA